MASPLDVNPGIHEAHASLNNTDDPIQITNIKIDAAQKEVTVEFLLSGVGVLCETVESAAPGQAVDRDVRDAVTSLQRKLAKVIKDLDCQYPPL